MAFVQTNPRSGIFCPMCDRRENGHTQSRMMNYSGGYKCDVCGFKPKDNNYQNLMALNPRLDKLVIQEKQPPTSVLHPFWINPEALTALQTRFPSNFRTTIYALFNALADPASILVEADNARELRDLGIVKGRDLVGLAKTNIALKDQLTQLQDQLKQYETLSKLMALAQGGLANTPQAQGPMLETILNPQAERPPQQPVMPVVITDSEVLYEPMTAGSFSDGNFGDPVSPPPPPSRPAGLAKPSPAAR